MCVCLCVSKELRGKSPNEGENTPTDSTDLLTTLTPGLLHGRSLWLPEKRRDVEEPQGVVLVQAEEMSAVRTPVAAEQVRTFAHQMEDTLLPARWALLDVHVGQVLGLGIRRLPHGACQRSRKRFAPSLGRRGRICGRSRVKRSLSSALEWGGTASPGQRLRDRVPVLRNILDKRCPAKTKVSTGVRQRCS